MNARTIRLSCAGLALLCGVASAWESRLFPRDARTGEFRRAGVEFDGRRWQLPDHSHVGYRLGAAPPADGVSCRAFPVSTEGDFAKALQSAVDAAGRAGGGTVRIPAGRFSLSRSIQVPWDGVAIVGAGSDATLIRVGADYAPAQDRDEGVFTFGKALGGWHKGWIDRGEVLATVTSPVAAGDSGVRVDDVGAFTPGDWVVVQQYYWPAFARLHSGGAWDAYDGFPVSGGNREASFALLRRVQGIAGNTLALDAPINRRMDPADNPVKLRSVTEPGWIAPRVQLGLAGVAIRFADNRAAADGRPLGVGVYFEGVRDGWVHDVQVHNFGRYGVRLEHSARITLRALGVYHAQDYGGSGYGYGIEVSASQQVLIDDSYIEDTRHGISTRSSLTSDLVVSRSESAASRQGGDDTHYGYVNGVLWDAHRLSWGTGLHALYRAGDSDGAYETNGGMVLWDVRGDGHRGGWYGGSIQLNPASDVRNLVIGGTGSHAVWDIGAELGGGQRMLPAPGLQTAVATGAPGPGSRDGNTLYEGLGHGGLRPASLYRQQLLQRLGALPESYSTACGPAPVPGRRAPSLRPGKETMVFDSDHLGFTPVAGHGCTVCDFDDPAARRGTDGEGMRLQMSSSNWAIGSSFRGPVLDSADFEALELWLRAPVGGYGLRLRLSLNGYPEGAVRTLGDHAVTGIAGGTWVRVEVPMSRFGEGAFNTLELRSIGSAGTQLVWLDDIVLR